MVQLDYEQEVKQVLKLIKDKKMSPQEGKQKIEKLKYKKEGSFSEGVAIIGMSGRFPGADNVSDFWNSLCNGKSCITEVPKKRWDNDKYYDPDVRILEKTNSRFGGFINDIDKFDPLFFNISGMEAEVMDPQQRLFLEESYHALEQAGYANDKVSGEKCGVYVASAPRDYLTQLDENNIAGSAQAFWGNTGSILASRISYYLNLKGPAISLDTACSSSLVAVHLACQGILSGDVKMAIAGGVWICTTQHYYILTSNAGMLSPDGKCKTFDNRADGIVNGECVGTIVLKSLKDAVKDHDHILGVIKSSGINQDGKTNGITAPSSLSQTKLEMEVYDKADINPETITYVEAHGTGTKLGDPIEVEALDHAFKQYTNKKHFCALGSVKTNIGHASLAAGIASVIKVLLALQYKKIPALLNYETLNEHIDLSQSAFYVNTKLKDWKGSGKPLRAAVSSFGLGGTNAHLVIEEYTKNKQSGVKKMFYPVTFSARTKEGLYNRVRDFSIWLKEDMNGYQLEDISYTLNVCRTHMEQRTGFVVENQQELKQKIDDFLKTETQYSKKTADGKNELELTKMIMELKNSDLQREEYRNKAVCLMEYYISGFQVEWEFLYKKEDCYKIPLPVYPFSRESYWPSKSDKEEVGLPRNQLHPFIDENVSSLKEQKFITHLNNKKFLKENMKVLGKSCLPHGCFLEMMMFAGSVSCEHTILEAKDFVIAEQNLDLSENLSLRTRLYSSGTDCYAEIVSSESEKGAFAQLKLVCDNPQSADTMPETDWIEIENSCIDTIPKEECYEFLHKSQDYMYSNRFKIIKNIKINSSKTEAVVTMDMTKKIMDNKEYFVLEPTLFEGVVQAAFFMTKYQKNTGKYRLSGFDRLKIENELSSECIMHIAITEEKADGTVNYMVQLMNSDRVSTVKINNLRIQRL